MAKQVTEAEKKQNAIVAANMELNGAGLVLKNATDLKVVAELFINSGVVPQCFDSAAKIAVVVEAGQELGFKPWQSIQNFHIVNGQLGLKSTAIGGLIRSSGVCEYLTQGYKGKEGADAWEAVVTSKRKDDPSEHVTTFSVADAKAAGLWGKDNWKRYPKDMLMWRALSRHGRAFYGDVLCGFYTEEELREIKPPAEQPTPEVPARDDRKQVESEVKDSKEILTEELENLLGEFQGYARTGLFGADAEDNVLDGIPNSAWSQALANCAAIAVDNDESLSEAWRSPWGFTLSNIPIIREHLQANGIPEPALAIIRDAMPLTPEQANERSKHLFEDKAEAKK